jgi:hypothetical protein
MQNPYLKPLFHFIINYIALSKKSQVFYLAEGTIVEIDGLRHATISGRAPEPSEFTFRTNGFLGILAKPHYRKEILSLSYPL